MPSSDRVRVALSPARVRGHDDDIRGDLRVLTPFAQHAVGIFAGAFGGDWTTNNLAYRSNMFQRNHIAFFRNQ